MQTARTDFVTASRWVPSFISPLNPSIYTRHISTPQVTSTADAIRFGIKEATILSHFITT
jgi:hypothetical protein